MSFYFVFVAVLFSLAWVRRVGFTRFWFNFDFCLSFSIHTKAKVVRIILIILFNFFMFMLWSLIVWLEIFLIHFQYILNWAVPHSPIVLKPSQSWCWFGFVLSLLVVVVVIIVWFLYYTFSYVYSIFFHSQFFTCKVTWHYMILDAIALSV